MVSKSRSCECASERSFGAGVSEAEVLLQGQQIVVQVPGGNRDSIKSVTKAAQALGSRRRSIIRGEFLFFSDSYAEEI